MKYILTVLLLTSIFACGTSSTEGETPDQCQVEDRLGSYLLVATLSSGPDECPDYPKTVVNWTGKDTDTQVSNLDETGTFQQLGLTCGEPDFYLSEDHCTEGFDMECHNSDFSVVANLSRTLTQTNSDGSRIMGFMTITVNAGIGNTVSCTYDMDYIRQ